MSAISYEEFLQSKITVAEQSGFNVDLAELDGANKPHQSATIQWALRMGKGLIGGSFGLGKTRIQCQIAKFVVAHTSSPFLVVAPLSVKQQFQQEDGPQLGMEWIYVRNDAEAYAAVLDGHHSYLITNYERVRDGSITQGFIDYLGGVSLDEGSVLRSLDTKTSDVFKKLFANTPYRFVATATPAPNEYKELIYFAEFLGVMDHGQALTRFFKRDSEHAGHLTLMPSQEENFWAWVASWALFITKPSDLGYSDEGYELPKLNIHWHRVTTDQTRAWEQMDSRGQRRLFLDAAAGVREASAEKRETLPERLAEMKRIMAESEPEKHWLLWHTLEAERRSIEREIPNVVAVYGSQDLETREQAIIDFSYGQIPILATKMEIAGSGCNFQRFCHSNIYLGIDYRFEDFIQSVHRTYRYLQTHEVDIHVIYAESEEAIVATLKRKWTAYDRLMAKMQAIIKKYGLSELAIKNGLSRKIGVERVEVQGNFYTAVNADCVTEVKRLPDNSVGLWLTSIPFGNHYEYSTQYEDFGHNPSDDSFWRQMDYLIPEMLRTLKPGRVAAIHVKDRQLYGHQTRSGIMETAPFSDECVMAFRRHGWTYQGRRTIATDVVRENNSTYRLSYGEMLKDASKMSSGLPEYMLLFRKPPTSTATARADEPVRKKGAERIYTCPKCGYEAIPTDTLIELTVNEDTGEETEVDGLAACPACGERVDFVREWRANYSLGRWQVDAHAIWKTSGDAPLTPAEMVEKYPLPEQIAELFKQEQLTGWYDYERHVAICEELERRGHLPKFFMLLPPKVTRGEADMVWDDVVFMRTLNSAQSQGRKEKHICPLPFDIVERGIRLYSNEGDLVGDPFGGLGTVAERSIRLHRRAWICELARTYFVDLTHYCQAAELEISRPVLPEFGEYMGQAVSA